MMCMYIYFLFFVSLSLFGFAYCTVAFCVYYIYLVYRDCIGCFPIIPYLKKFQFSLSVSTSTTIKVKITIQINPYQKFDVHVVCV